MQLGKNHRTIRYWQNWLGSTYQSPPARHLLPPTTEGGANPELDAEFGSEEIRQAMHDLNGRSAPGPDKITNKGLRILDDRSVEYPDGCRQPGVEEW
ncbi:hypothetical protein MTO96_040925 [Rhipicephalus appendiculatus]